MNKGFTTVKFGVRVRVRCQSESLRFKSEG